eukprot:TRINITY_DN84342_c0_g1_i1.p1 TRINITY_DN84342_c0_g1~~TRINITY_DN84342_c0_g1_i1.p1  ORF type:complete len:207 (-),score=26.18 TRINITY_DN84342_c0_g1_i1:41-661(-)
MQMRLKGLCHCRCGLLLILAFFVSPKIEAFAGGRFGRGHLHQSSLAALPDREVQEELVTISTDSFLEAQPDEVLAIVATAANWPSIVLSSTSVSGQTDMPLRQGDAVEEYFGLPPLWSPCVRWVCKAADFKEGVLDVRSSDGVNGLADSCRMLFTVSQKSGGTHLRLDMSYRPCGWLAKIARPFLEIDNTLALKVLLPAEVKRQCS